MAGARVPGLAVGVRVGSDEVMAGYGVTSVEDPLPVHDRTLFQIGSVSKTFTAAAIMALVERGRLTLDDPVCRFLPTFRLPAPGLAEQVTVRHLLTHTAGFVGDWFLVRPPRTGGGRRRARAGGGPPGRVPQLFPPGGGWSYNNAGFSLAGRVVEVLTGRPYAAALHDLVLGPLGLDGTFVSADEAITHRTALPHASRKRPRVLRGAGWQPGWQLDRADVPLGGLISGVHDLLGWARFHLGLPAGDPPVRRRSRQGPSPRCRRRSPRPAASPTTSAIAWMLRTVGGRRFVGHGGLTTGYATAFTLVPDAGAAVVVLTNATPGGIWLGREVTRTILRETIGVDDAPPAPAPSLGVDPREYTGRYDNPFAVQAYASGRGRRARAGAPCSRAGARALGAASSRADRLGFYASDRVVALAPPGQAGLRGDFGRDAAGRVAWLRWGGRLAPRLGD